MVANIKMWLKMSCNIQSCPPPPFRKELTLLGQLQIVANRYCVLRRSECSANALGRPIRYFGNRASLEMAVRSTRRSAPPTGMGVHRPLQITSFLMSVSLYREIAIPIIMFHTLHLIAVYPKLGPGDILVSWPCYHWALMSASTTLQAELIVIAKRQR